MKRIALALAFGAVLLVSGCQCETITGDRLHEINDEWNRIYNTDRRPTQAEVDAFEALTDDQKEEWRTAGKPVLMPLSELLLDAAKDHHKTIGMEADAAKGEKEDE